MGLSRRKKEGKRNISVSFRISEETEQRLRTLAEYNQQGLTGVFVQLIDDEYDRLLAEEPKRLKKAERDS